MLYAVSAVSAMSAMFLMSAISARCPVLRTMLYRFNQPRQCEGTLAPPCNLAMENRFQTEDGTGAAVVTTAYCFHHM